MRPTIIIVIIFFVENSLQEVEFYDEENTASSVRYRLVNAVLHPYSRHLNDTPNVYVCAKNPFFLGKLSASIPLTLINDWDILGKTISENKAGSLIAILDGDAPDENSYDLEHLRDVRTKHSVLVICYGAAKCHSEVYLKRIAESTDSPTLHYVVVDEEESVIRIYERTTTAEGSCGVPRLVRLPYDSADAWLIDGKFSVPVNFNKCPIRLATWYSPTKSQPCKLGDSNHFCGIEGEIVRNIVDKINATPVTIMMDNGQEVRDLVAMGDADLGYGHLHVDTNKTFIYSKWYIYIKATIVVPHSASGSGASLLAMALPLQSEVWIGFAVTIASIFILTIPIPYFRSLGILQQFGTIIGISVPIQPRQIPQRIYFFSIVLFGFLISQIYLVNLTKIYSSVSKPHIIKTLEELEELGIRIYGSNVGKQMLIEFGYPRIAEKNYEVMQVDKRAVKLIRGLMGQSSDPIYVEIDVETIPSWKNVEAMEQMVRLYSLGLVTPNSSSLMIASDQVIMKVLESGIRNKESIRTLTGKDAVIYAWLHGQGYLETNKTGEPTKLGLKDLQGVFVLLAVGLSLCVLVFVTELAVNSPEGKLTLKRRARIPFARMEQTPRVSGILIPRKKSSGGLIRENENLVIPEI